MKKRVLLSIHPEYANAIFSGKKGFEFRRVLPKRTVHEVFVYATAPISRVIGRFLIEEIYEGTPDELWKRTEPPAGVSKEKFDAYFEGKRIAFAIKVSDPILFSRPKPLSTYLTSKTPPQSFCYI